jgi:hypothetical protein
MWLKNNYANDVNKSFSIDNSMIIVAKKWEGRVMRKWIENSNDLKGWTNGKYLRVVTMKTKCKTHVVT